MTAMNYNEENDTIESRTVTFEVAPSQSGSRLDRIAAENLPEVSRSRLKSWIEDGLVLVNGEVCAKPSKKLLSPDAVIIKVLPLPETLAFREADVPFECVYEDRDILIVNKRAGLVVHPAAGHWDDTLLNGLLYRYPELKTLPRAGIVHRLDKDTTGLMVVARSPAAQDFLIRELSARRVHRQYWAVVHGCPPELMTIENTLVRDPRNPLRFEVSQTGAGRYAKTLVKNIVSSKGFSLVACKLFTGRTHQIRVHLMSAGFPIAGDPLYKGRTAGLAPGVFPMDRQALHAARLGFVHPGTLEPVHWFAVPPEDFLNLASSLQLPVELDDPDYFA